MTPRKRKPKHPRPYIAVRARIQDACRVTGLSGRALAARLGVNERTVRRWLAGEQPLSRSALAHLDLLLSTYDETPYTHTPEEPGR